MQRGASALAESGLSSVLKRSLIRSLKRKAIDTKRSRDARRAALVDTCRRSLEDIHFQRSYTTGWSGALKFIPGVDAGANAAVALAQRQQTVPEIVTQFVKLLGMITANGTYDRVIVAIDELDKFDTDEDARHLINDIKAVFRVPRCFFLIAVSDSAIASFDRPGLRFRDALDSAFDEIVRMDYLTLSGSRQLLSRRALNVPGPFVCLAHVLSGGLPRRLIRTARAIVERASQHAEQNTLMEVTQALVQAEVEGAALAATLATRDIELEPEHGEFLEWVASLDTRDLISGVVEWTSREFGAGGRVASPEGDRIQKLRAELSTFVSCAATTIQLFSSIVDEATWLRAEQEWVEPLTQARQGLELGSGIARYRINKVRTDHGLPVSL